MTKVAWFCHSAATFTDGDDDATLYNLVRANLPNGYVFSPNKKWHSLVTYDDASGLGVGGACTRDWTCGQIVGATLSDIYDASIVIVGTFITDFIWPYNQRSLLFGGGKISDAVKAHLNIIDTLSRQGKYIIWHAPYCLDSRTAAEGNPYGVIGGPFDASINPDNINGNIKTGDFVLRVNAILYNAIELLLPELRKRDIPIIDQFSAIKNGDITIGYDDNYPTGYTNLGIHINAQSHMNLYDHFMPLFEAALHKFNGGF